MTALAQALVNGATDGLFLALMALGITLVFGIARFSNIAHGDFATLGAYGTLWVGRATGLPLVLAVPGGLVLAVAVGLAAWRLLFRQIGDRPVTAMLASIGLSIFLRGAITLVAGSHQRSFDLPLWRAWKVAGVRILPMEVVIAGASLAVLLTAQLILRRTRIGAEMRAVADNPLLARTSGIRPERVALATWVLALAVAGLAGVFLGIRTAVSPEMGWNFLLPAFAAAVLGGMGSPAGAILAGLLLGIGQNLAVIWIDNSYKIAFAFVVLIAVLLVRPGGMAGMREVAR